MTSVAGLVSELVSGRVLTGATLSKPVGAPGELAAKVTVDPVDVKAGERYRWRHHHPTRTVDEILTPEETDARLTHLIGGSYRQALLRSPEADFQVLAGGDREPRILRRPASRPVAAAAVLPTR